MYAQRVRELFWKFNNPLNAQWRSLTQQKRGKILIFARLTPIVLQKKVSVFVFVTLSRMDDMMMRILGTSVYW